MTIRTVAGILAGCCLTVCVTMPVLADDAPPVPDGGEGRYTFSKVPDGYLRLDTQTGEVSVCNQRSVGWACQLVPEDRAVLENEIARLRRENATLKKDILARGLPLPGGAVADAPTARDGDRSESDGEADLDRVITLVSRMWHRIVDAIAQAQRQVLKKS